MYQTINNIAQKFFKKSTIYKYGFNLSPMYRRSTAKIVEVSDDLMHVKVKIPISYKNKNYVGSIFGGSLFSATDPIFMIQLMNILGKDYVVWDKQASIRFRRPVFENAYVDFLFTIDEIEQIKKDVVDKKEIDVEKEIKITNSEGAIVFCELTKVIYVADKAFYKAKRKLKN